MATLFSHPAIALALAPWFRDSRKSKPILITAMALTVLPDIDVIGLRAGIPYEHPLGHRGLTHSLYIAALVSAVLTLFFAFRMEIRAITVWLYLFLSMSSHGLVDAMTNGGLGVAFLAPFSDERYFLPYRPFEVSTLNISNFFAGEGIPVLLSELLYLWPVCLVIFALGYTWKNSSPPKS